MAWRTAKSLNVLLAELKAQFSLRDNGSDGAIGNQEHASRKSDHNPDHNGVVRARDYDEDLDGVNVPTGEKKMALVAEHIRQLGEDGDPRLVGGAANGYVIYEGRIAGAGKGWAWRQYTGVNAHEHHMHVSVCSNPAGYDSTASWGIADLFIDVESHEKPKPALVAANEMESSMLPRCVHWNGAIFLVGYDLDEFTVFNDKDQPSGQAATGPWRKTFPNIHRLAQVVEGGGALTDMSKATQQAPWGVAFEVTNNQFEIVFAHRGVA